MAEKLGDAVLELRTDSTKLGQGIDNAEQKAKGLGQTFDKVGATMLAAFGAAALLNAIKKVGTALVDLSTEAVKAADVQIQAEAKLAQAIRATGGEVESALPSFKKWAAEIQRITTVGDEAALGMAQVALSMGLSEDAAKLASQEAIGLAAAFGLSEKAAIRYTAGLAEGDTTMLNRYIPTLRAVEDEAERVALAHEILGDAFQLAVGEAQAGLGPLDQLSNAYSDLQEVLGAQLMPAVQAASKALTEIAQQQKTIDMFKQLGEVIIELSLVLTKVVIGFGLFLEVLGKVGSAMAFLPGITKEAAAEWTEFGKQVKETALSIALAMDGVKDKLAASTEGTESLLAGFEGVASAAGDLETRLERIQGLIKSHELGIKALRKEHEAVLAVIEEQVQHLEWVEEAHERAVESVDELLPIVESIAVEWGDIGDIYGDVLLPSQEELNKLAEHFRSVWEGLGPLIEEEVAGALFNITNDILDGGDIDQAFEDAGAHMGQTMGAAIGFEFGGPVGASIGAILGEKVGEVAGKIAAQGLAARILKKLTEPSFKEKAFAFFEGFDAGAVSVGEVTKAVNLLIKAMGKLSAETATRLLAENFDAVVEAAIRLGGPALDALSKLTAEIERTGVGAEILAEKLAEVMDEAASVLAQRSAFILSQVDQMLAGIEGLALGSAGAVKFAATTVTQAFNAMVEAGAPITEIVEKLGAQFKEIGEAGKVLGLELSPEFERLGEMITILAEKGLQNVIKGLEGIGAAAQAAGNLGLLTAEQFTFLSQKINGAFNKLVEGGLTGKEAIAALAPQLQLLNDLSEQYGFTLGGNTKALVEQGIEMGIVTDKGLTLEDILIKGFDRILEALNRVIVALGGVPVLFNEIAGAAENAGAEIEGAANRGFEAWQKFKEGFGGGFEFSFSGGPGFEHGSGEFMNFGSGTQTILHGTEQVITAAEGESMQSMILAALRTANTSAPDEEAALLRQLNEWAALSFRQGEEAGRQRDTFTKKLDKTTTSVPFFRPNGVIG